MKKDIIHTGHEDGSVRRFLMSNPEGLHMRPSTRLARELSLNGIIPDEVFLVHGEQEESASGGIRLVELGIHNGDYFDVHVTSDLTDEQKTIVWKICDKLCRPHE
ncbi:MAG: hypothetical protein KC680_02640 [Candidatus Peregrinibacteria bacterium]|nr:hypothetical protein [Candidatus Peregrinibacteria bacterium]MCB9808600.1 hypothetical protein [Candidatus Peribacteria bacterium]